MARLYNLEASLMLLLASTSPRRKEIMDFFTLPYKQVPPPFDEATIDFAGCPEKYVKTLSEGKALSVLEKHPDQLVLAADTVVVYEGKVYEKPKDKKHAIEMLMQLQGTWHQVYSGITLVNKDQRLSDVETSRILLKDCTLQEVTKYVNTYSCLDKAGGYGIQGTGNIMIDRIEGCFYNACGLPTNALERALKMFGIYLWDYLKS